MIGNDKFPFVSICTPTYNRRPFIETMFECFSNQTYPSDKMEWIIVDDGTDKIEDLIALSGIPQIKYFALKGDKLTLGAKRNLMHTKCTGSIIVYMDDDDYYPPERVSHAVERLLETPTALCAGASEIYVYFNHISKMYQAGPYGPNHATAGTFAFRKELLLQTQYNSEASLAEEKDFLKNYQIPFVQLDPLKTILVFSHIQNTFDKKILIERETNLFKVSDKTVETFIKYEFEASIKSFFLKNLDEKLKAYKPGDPIMKPDVIKQMKQIEEERKKMTHTGQIIMNRPGEESRALSNEEVVQLIQAQQSELNDRGKLIEELKKKNTILESLVAKLKNESKKQEKKADVIHIDM